MKKTEFSNDKIKKKFKLILIMTIISFSFIIYKLFDLMFINNDSFVAELSIRQNKTYVSEYASRGRILDRNGKVLVDNEKVYTITYTKKSGISDLSEIKLASKLTKFLDLEYEKVSLESLKNYYYLLNYNKIKSIANKNITQKYENKLINKIEYEEYLKKLIKNSDINSLTEDDKKTAYIYYLMNIGYRNSKKIIKENIDSNEANNIKEYLSNGFEIGINYKRVYPYGSVFRAYLGNIGSIPEEDIESYLKKGYRRDKLVGVSYLEKEYEEYLKGNDEEYILTASGEKIVTQELKKGTDITLSIDINLQKDIESIIYKQVVSAKKEANTKYFNRSFVIMSNPNTGEILAASAIGVINNKNKSKVDYLTDLTNYALTPGSIVKGASHIVGYKYGAIKIGTTVTDGCIKVKNTPEKCSWKRLGKINDLTALKYSSNYYQFLIAIKIGNGKYKYNSGLNLDTEGFKKYREVFNSFGLGVKTGIDIPNETVGYIGNDTNGGALLDYPIGQYETYTPMQLMQYINTLATSGIRNSLHFLKSIDGNDYKTKVLNEVQIDDVYMERVKEGLRMVMESGGTGRSNVDPKYKAAGKTGTAQSFIDTNRDGVIDTETTSSAFGAYIPYDNPKVSVVVFSPNVSDRKTSYMSRVNRKIAKEVTNLYFNKYNTY